MVIRRHPGRRCEQDGRGEEEERRRELRTRGTRLHGIVTELTIATAARTNPTTANHGRLNDRTGMASTMLMTAVRMNGITLRTRSVPTSGPSEASEIRTFRSEEHPHRVAPDRRRSSPLCFSLTSPTAHRRSSATPFNRHIPRSLEPPTLSDAIGLPIAAQTNKLIDSDGSRTDRRERRGQDLEARATSRAPKGRPTSRARSPKNR